jgi:hypothetical protein
MRSEQKLPSLVQPHPPPGLYSSSLSSRVPYLKPDLEGVVVGVAQPGVRLALEGGELGGYVREVSSDLLCGVCVVSWLAHALRVHISAHDSRAQTSRDLTLSLCRGSGPLSLLDSLTA